MNDTGQFHSQATMFDTVSHKHVSAFNVSFFCVADKTNQQLTCLKNELLLCHWKLGINMQHVQELMYDRVHKNGDDMVVCLSPILPTKYATTKNCAILMYMSCELAKMHAKTSKVKVSKAIAE